MADYKDPNRDLNKAANRTPTVIRSPARPARIRSASARERPAAARPGGHRRRRGRPDRRRRRRGHRRGGGRPGRQGRGGSREPDGRGRVLARQLQDASLRRPRARATTSTVPRTSTAGSPTSRYRGRKFDDVEPDLRRELGEEQGQRQPAVGQRQGRRARRVASRRAGDPRRLRQGRTVACVSAGRARRAAPRTLVSPAHRPPRCATRCDARIRITAMRAVAVVPGQHDSLHRPRRRSRARGRDGRRRSCACSKPGVCGTDVEIDDGLYGEAPPGSPYLILGHENLGRRRVAPAGVARPAAAISWSPPCAVPAPSAAVPCAERPERHVPHRPLPRARDQGPARLHVRALRRSRPRYLVRVPGHLRPFARARRADERRRRRASSRPCASSSAWPGSRARRSSWARGRSASWPRLALRLRGLEVTVASRGSPRARPSDALLREARDRATSARATTPVERAARAAGPRSTSSSRPRAPPR